MPRVVITSPGPPSAVGGVERWSANVIDIMRRAGWDADAVWPQSAPPDNVMRFGLGGLWYARAVAEQLDGHIDLIVSSGFLGATMPRSVRRIAVFHGTMTGQSIVGDLEFPRHYRARRVLALGGAEALSARNATVVAVARRAAGEL